MVISELKAVNFRNFSQLILTPNPQLNLIYGENASGKTSFLEALYFLSYGKSFRAQQNKYIIHKDSSQFTVFSKLRDVKTAVELPVGLSRGLKGEALQKIQGSVCSNSDLAHLLPVQLLNNDSFLLLSGGPKTRRQFIDWGAFYLNENFIESWRQYQKILKHRNIALKNKVPIKELQIWDQLLVIKAQVISDIRKAYLADFIIFFEKELKKVVEINNLQINYFQGWPQGESLAELLKMHYKKDLSLGYTFYGAHRADLRMTIDKTPVQNVLSRGQQKIVVWIMKFVQAALLKQQCPILLIDDIRAELDDERLNLFCQLFSEIPCQIFATSIKKEDLQFFESFYTDYSMFHVKHNSLIHILD